MIAQDDHDRADSKAQASCHVREHFLFPSLLVSGGGITSLLILGTFWAYCFLAHTRKIGEVTARQVEPTYSISDQSQQEPALKPQFFSLVCARK
jgi:hypothetical protein